MSTVVILEVTSRPEKAEQLADLLRSLLPDSRAFDGCLGIDLHQSSDDAACLVFVERWTSKEHHQRYVAWRRDRGDSAAIGNLTTGPPSVRYFHVIDTGTSSA